VLLLRLIEYGQRARFESFIRSLKDPDPRARAGAADFLGSIGPDARVCIPELEEALSDNDPYVRVCAAGALWKLDHGKRDQVIPILVAELNREGRLHNVIAVKTLGEMGPEAEAAVPALEKLLKADSTYQQTLVAGALAQIDKSSRKATFEILKRGLRDEHQGPRMEALQVLAKLGTDAREFAPDLRLLQNDPDGAVQQYAEVALKAIEGNARPNR